MGGTAAVVALVVRCPAWHVVQRGVQRGPVPEFVEQHHLAAIKKAHPIDRWKWRHR